MDHKAFTMIRKQIKNEPPRSMLRLMAAQLEDIITTTPGAAELVAQDLAVPEMGLEALKEKFDEFAEKHKNGSEACIFPEEAEQIIREFYGISKAGEPECKHQSKVISLFDLV